MVDQYGRWTYEPDTPEEKKCDCDRVADWIINTGYKPETSIEYLTEIVICCTEDYYTIERGEAWEFDVDELKDYVIYSGGLKGFDFYC